MPRCEFACGHSWMRDIGRGDAFAGSAAHLKSGGVISGTTPWRVPCTGRGVPALAAIRQMQFFVGRFGRISHGHRESSFQTDIAEERQTTPW